MFMLNKISESESESESNINITIICTSCYCIEETTWWYYAILSTIKITCNSFIKLFFFTTSEF